MTAATVTALLLARPAAAAWSHDVTVAVPMNANAVTQSTIDGGSVADGSGGLFVAFLQSNGASQDVMVQHFTANGTVAPGWPVNGAIACSVTFPPSNARAVTDANGGVIVAWQDRRRGVTDVFVQRLSAAGAPLWAGNGVLATSLSSFDKPNYSICPDFAGGAYIGYDFFISAADIDIYLTHATAAGTAPTIGVATPVSLQQNPQVVPDDAGGCFITFQDNASGDYDIKFARYSNALSSLFGTVNLTQAALNSQAVPKMIPDGVGGVYVAWQDDRSALQSLDLYATRRNANGSLAAGWGSTGTRLCGKTTFQINYSLVTDAQHGLYAVWEDTHNGVSQNFATHFGSAGVILPGWSDDGDQIGPYSATRVQSVSDGAGGIEILSLDARTPSTQTFSANHLTPARASYPLTPTGGRVVVSSFLPLIGSFVSDDQGGAFLVWSDNRTGFLTVFAQHVDRYCALGDARPVSTGIKDVPADQGGHTRLGWNASWMDGDPDWGIDSYWLWRQAPLTLADAAVRAGATWADGMRSDDRPAGARVFQHDAAAASPYAWELLTQQPANGSARYSYVASTTSDSIAGHNPYTVFMVEAHSALDTRAFWQMAPDSGYSVDNLPPVIPAPFTAQYVAGTAALHWNPNVDTDLAGYRLYRGSSVGFVPGAGNLVAAPTDTGYVDAAASPFIYKLTAIDVHGNESKPAVVTPAGTLAVDDALPRQLAFALASPNPARAGAVMRFALPSAAHVRIALFDAAGRQVRELANGEFAAGTFTRAWDGADASGAVAPSGLYFARMQSGSRVLTTRFVLTH
jgi:hypothetical protein